MLTALSRRCHACQTYLEGTEPACPSCGTVLVPSHTLWPASLKRLLTLFLIADATITLTSVQEKWERVLSNTIKGRQYGDRRVQWSALPIDCYPVAIQLLAEWEQAGCPTDFTTLDTLRRRLALAAAA